jgi:hypothetical protein
LDKRRMPETKIKTTKTLSALWGFCALLAPTSAIADETRGFVVSWFTMASSAQDGDCSQGLNLDVDAHQRKVLADLGKSPEEIEKLVGGGVPTLQNLLQRRGRVQGQPVYIYLNPASLPDPKIKTLDGRLSVGFNLDGKLGPLDFVDPETKEPGIDNRAYRALGCYDAQRAPLGHRPSFLSSSWDTVRDAMPAWVIEVSKIDDPMNDDDVEITMSQAVESMVRNPATGDAQPDTTYQIWPNSRTHSKARGKITNGVLITAPFSVYLLGDPMYIPEYDFIKARLRLPIAPKDSNRTVKGVMGGYLPWKTVYWGTCGNIGMFCETTHSYDPSGIFYALTRMADAEPDPNTGTNTRISTAFSIEATTAFIVHASFARRERED